MTAAAVPLVGAMIQAAASRGEDLDGFVMDFVYPSIKGPSIKGKRVVLLDSWLSEKSYVQTSSLVTLRNGNELSLDFGVVEHEGAKVVAIASLIGGVDMTEPVIEVVNPVSGERQELPFVENLPRIRTAIAMHKPNPISLAAKASGEPEFREVGVGPWTQEHPVQPRPDDPEIATKLRIDATIRRCWMKAIDART